jgi:hypothetical protein
MVHELDLQTEALSPETVDREALSVCLPPWLENPYRLASLLDMIQFSAEMWFWSGYALENLLADCLFMPGPGAIPFPVAILHAPIKQETRDKAVEWLAHVREECEKIGLTISAETVTELVDGLDVHDWQWLDHQLRGLQKMIRKEMKAKVFFYITPEKMRFWPTQRAPYAFTEAVALAFPATTLDANEAGVCLATARATACVFHLMRVLEIALAALGKLFNVSLAHTNWAPAIEEIESKIRNMHKDPVWKAMSDCKEQQEFYSQAASHFGILKDAWRNYTAHARSVYTEESAALIFDNTKAFMQKLATRLHE